MLLAVIDCWSQNLIKAAIPCDVTSQKQFVSFNCLFEITTPVCGLLLVGFVSYFWKTCACFRYLGLEFYKPKPISRIRGFKRAVSPFEITYHILVHVFKYMLAYDSGNLPRNTGFELVRLRLRLCVVYVCKARSVHYAVSKTANTLRLCDQKGLFSDNA